MGLGLPSCGRGRALRTRYLESPMYVGPRCFGILYKALSSVQG